jgi:hypothetical protein
VVDVAQPLPGDLAGPQVLKRPFPQPSVELGELRVAAVATAGHCLQRQSSRRQEGAPGLIPQRRY